MGTVIDGREVAAKVRAKIADDVAKMTAKGVVPGLAVIIVGNNQASRAYVNNKEKACADVGIHSEEYALPEETTEDELLSIIDKLNVKDDIDGILVQLPLPKQINSENVINRIVPSKDVDAFHPVNVGKMLVGNYDFSPCTPAGVIELIKATGEPIEGKNCVVIGRSNIVGKPMAILLMHENGTVTICHSKTRDLKSITSKADILVSSVGKPKFVTADMVKDGAIVIDVGMNRDENGKRCGDVIFDEVMPKTSYITPVPYGVGPMTITMLLKNTLKAAELRREK